MDPPLARRDRALLAMVGAAVFFLVALLVGKSDYDGGPLGGGLLALTLVGFALLTLGGWLGGTIVFVYGMRVLGLEVPALEAVKPLEPDERKAA